MKKILFLCFCCVAIAKANAQNFDLSTLRIGGFKINMPIDEVKKISEKPLKLAKNEYHAECKVAVYQGAEIYLDGLTMYEGGVESELKVYGMSTKSPKFRTKSGIGVGSTKAQIMEAYKEYPSFSFYKEYDFEAKKYSSSKSTFTLDDVDAGTKLSFFMENNVVVRVQVYMNEGC